jgi:hypothetical protein
MHPAVAEQIRAAVQARLRELQPLLAELEQLQSVLAVLDGHNAGGRTNGELDAHELSRLLRRGGLSSLAGTPAGVGPARRPGRLGSKPGRDGRAPQGANKQRILATIAEHPGITAPQVARLTGLGRPLVASTISRLKRTGELLPHDGGVRLPSLHTSALVAGSGLGELATRRTGETLATLASPNRPRHGPGG